MPLSITLDRQPLVDDTVPPPRRERNDPDERAVVASANPGAVLHVRAVLPRVVPSANVIHFSRRR